MNINVAPVIDIYNHNKSHGMFAKNSKYNQINQKITERKSERTLKNQWDYFRYLVTRDYRKYSLSGLMKAFPFFSSCFLLLIRRSWTIYSTLQNTNTKCPSFFIKLFFQPQKNIKYHKLFNRLKVIATMVPFSYFVSFFFFTQTQSNPTEIIKIAKRTQRALWSILLHVYFYYCYQCYCYVSYYDFTIIVGELIFKKTTLGCFSFNFCW